VRNALDGLIVTACLRAEHSQQMPGLGVKRLDLEDLPIGGLSRIASAGLVVLNGAGQGFRDSGRAAQWRLRFQTK
jgi:hypothetical protein